jgi:hypothetical protein
MGSRKSSDPSSEKPQYRRDNRVASQEAARGDAQSGATGDCGKQEPSL